MNGRVDFFVKLHAEAFEITADLGAVNRLILVSLTNNLESVGNDCFAGCPKITDVYFTGSAHDWRLLSEGADMGMAENVSMHYSNQIRPSVGLSSLQIHLFSLGL